MSERLRDLTHIDLDNYDVVPREIAEQVEAERDAALRRVAELERRLEQAVTDAARAFVAERERAEAAEARVAELERERDEAVAEKWATVEGLDRGGGGWIIERLKAAEDEVERLTRELAEAREDVGEQDERRRLMVERADEEYDERVAAEARVAELERGRDEYERECRKAWRLERDRADDAEARAAEAEKALAVERERFDIVRSSQQDLIAQLAEAERRLAEAVAIAYKGGNQTTDDIEALDALAGAGE